MELYQWAHYIHAFGPLDHGARIFARLDAGFAALEALIINRSGGLAPNVGAQPEAVAARKFMWEPGPDPAPPKPLEGTAEVFGAMFGVDVKKAKAAAKAAKEAKAKAEAEETKRGA